MLRFFSVCAARQVAAMDEDELFVFAKHIQAPFSLVQVISFLSCRSPVASS